MYIRCANVTWEFIYSFLSLPSTGPTVIVIIWMVLDLGLV